MFRWWSGLDQILHRSATWTSLEDEVLPSMLPSISQQELFVFLGLCHLIIVHFWLLFAFSWQDSVQTGGPLEPSSSFPFSWTLLKVFQWTFFFLPRPAGLVALISLAALTSLAALILLGLARTMLEPPLPTAMLVVHLAIIFTAVSLQSQYFLWFPRTSRRKIESQVWLSQAVARFPCSYIYGR